MLYARLYTHHLSRLYACVLRYSASSKTDRSSAGGSGCFSACSHSHSHR